MQLLFRIYIIYVLRYNMFYYFVCIIIVNVVYILESYYVFINLTFSLLEYIKINFFPVKKVQLRYFRLEFFVIKISYNNKIFKGKN